MPTTEQLLAQLARAAQRTRDDERKRDELVQAARAAGATWDQIAKALGVTRQTAHGKHGKGAPRPKE